VPVVMSGPGLSLAEWVILGLLSEAPSHGFALARTLSHSTVLGQVWTFSRPHVYWAMGRLEKQGMIAVVRQEPGIGPTRTVYMATENGNRALAQWRLEPVRHLREVESAFLAKVLLRLRAGEALAPLVAAQRAVFDPLFKDLADEFAGREADQIVTFWRYEFSRAVARLIDNLESIDQIEAPEPRSRRRSTKVNGQPSFRQRPAGEAPA
jgi:DNA-binding PadR family transcriptional regulator